MGNNRIGRNREDKNSLFQEMFSKHVEYRHRQSFSGLAASFALSTLKEKKKKGKHYAILTS